jgi:hypothetical protein
MAKSSDSGGLGCLLFIGIIAFLVLWAKASFSVALAVLAGFIVLVGYLGSRAAKARRDALVARFGAQIADAIIAKKYWQGATFEMMREAHGEPAEVRQKVLKAKTRETHCYQQKAKNRFALKLHYEDGVVVGWDA